MSEAPSKLRLLTLGLVLTFLVGLVFILLIETGRVTGVLPHEVAAAILFVSLVIDLWFALGLRQIDARPAARVLLALVALFAAAALGSLLATADVPSVLDGAPLIPLLILLLATADAARLTRRIERAAVDV